MPISYFLKPTPTQINSQQTSTQNGLESRCLLKFISRLTVSFHNICRHIRTERTKEPFSLIPCCEKLVKIMECYVSILVNDGFATEEAQ